MAVDHDRLFIRVDRVIRDDVKYMLGQTIPLPKLFTDDAWVEWPIPEEVAEPLG